jgi:hypothetical protein
MSAVLEKLIDELVLACAELVFLEIFCSFGPRYL